MFVENGRTGTRNCDFPFLTFLLPLYMQIASLSQCHLLGKLSYIDSHIILQFAMDIGDAGRYYTEHDADNIGVE